MTLRQAKEIMDTFYDSAVYRIEKRGRDLWNDGVYKTLSDKTDAIITACIYSGASDRVVNKVQEYKFELEDKLRSKWSEINR